MPGATSLAIAGIATSAAGSGMSFIQAAKQNNLAIKAEMEAKKAMEEARKKLDVNFYDQLSINKEPYELQREAMLSQGAQAIQAAQEGERNVAATAGRVAMAQNEAQGQIRTAMGKEMQDLERLSATEESRLRDVNVQLDIETAKGAQQAAADARAQSARSVEQGIAGIQGAAKEGLSMLKLYGKDLDQGTIASLQLSPDQQKLFGEGFDLKTIGSMTSDQFNEWKKTLNKNQYNTLYGIQSTYLNNPANPFKL